MTNNVFLAFLMLAAGAPNAVAQTIAGASLPAPAKAYLGRLPHPLGLEKYLAALGDRVKTPGKERVTFTGVYTGPGGGPQAVSITKQLPGSVRIEIVGAGVLLFDGTQTNSSKASLLQADLDILETLALDSGEGFFDQLHNSGALRKLGEGFPLPGVKGASFDVFELDSPLRTAGTTKRTVKHYWFNHETGQLARVQHFDTGPGVPATATVISGWTTFAGHQVPGTIESLQGSGKIAHQFRITGWSFDTYGSEEVFKRP